MQREQTKPERERMASEGLRMGTEKGRKPHGEVIIAALAAADVPAPASPISAASAMDKPADNGWSIHAYRGLLQMGEGTANMGRKGMKRRWGGADHQ